MAIGFHASLITQLKHAYQPFSHNMYFRQLYLSTTNNQITGVHKKTPNFLSSLTTRTPKNFNHKNFELPLQPSNSEIHLLQSQEPKKTSRLKLSS